MVEMANPRCLQPWSAQAAPKASPAHGRTSTRCARRAEIPILDPSTLTIMGSPVLIIINRRPTQTPMDLSLSISLSPAWTALTRPQWPGWILSRRIQSPGRPNFPSTISLESEGELWSIIACRHLATAGATLEILASDTLDQHLAGGQRFAYHRRQPRDPLEDDGEERR